MTTEQMTELRTIYTVEPVEGEMDAPQVEDTAMRAVLLEIRRALITQLRAVERALGISPSIPPRKRPH